MDRFLAFLSVHMNGIINCAGTAVLIFLIYNLFRINSHKDRIKDALGRKNTKSNINKKTFEISDEDVAEAVTPDTIRGYETAFNKSVAIFNSIAQLIPIFPLFGILGTVAGLILQLQANGDLSKINESLNLALYSTFWGLIWAIILKAFVAILSERIIEDTEILLEDYNKKFDNTIKLRNITEQQ